MHAADYQNIDHKSSRNAFFYAPYYCEENAYHLASKLLENQVQVQVIFICNQTRTCLMLQQKAADTGQAVIWDYHVIVMTGQRKMTAIWDLDTRLHFPCSASDYLELSFPQDIALRYRSLFRVIDANEFLRKFSSDRRHMLNADGTWIKTPPPWPPIRGSDAATDHDLESFLNLNSGYRQNCI